MKALLRRLKETAQTVLKRIKSYLARPHGVVGGLISVTTLVVSGLVMGFSASSFGLASLLVVSIHELGHFIAARLTKRNPGVVVFIPLYKAIAGFQAISTKGPPVTLRYAIIAGPAAGLAAISILYTFRTLPPLIGVSFVWLLAWEIFNLILGPDGKALARIHQR